MISAAISTENQLATDGDWPVPFEPKGCKWHKSARIPPDLQWPDDAAAGTSSVVVIGNLFSRSLRGKAVQSQTVNGTQIIYVGAPMIYGFRHATKTKYVGSGAELLNLATASWESNSTASSRRPAPLAPSPIGNTHARRDFDALLSQAERLRDGWAGPGSVAPAAQIVADLRKLLVTLQGKARAPEVEVDSDGTIDLFWARDGGTFSLSVSGSGSVLGVLISSGGDYSSWTVSVDDEVALAEKVEDDLVGFYLEK